MHTFILTKILKQTLFNNDINKLNSFANNFPIIRKDVTNAAAGCEITVHFTFSQLKMQKLKHMKTCIFMEKLVNIAAFLA